VPGSIDNGFGRSYRGAQKHGHRSRSKEGKGLADDMKTCVFLELVMVFFNINKNTDDLANTKG
jgi:hypothetical protein